MLEVLTYRDRSLLAAMAHDLCIDAQPEVRFEGGLVTVRCRVDTLRVRGKVVAGGVEPLPERDRAQIETTLRRDVLHAERCPEVLFEGERLGSTVRGVLRLHGRSLPLELEFVVTGGRARGEVGLVPSRWGIAPFSAMLGALKVQDRVLIRFDVPVT